MPCSRSAERPSTSSAKSSSSPCVPCFFESLSSASSWSSSSALASYSRRPIRVDLPSSTLPQVMKRSSDLFWCVTRYCSMSFSIRAVSSRIRAGLAHHLNTARHSRVLLAGIQRLCSRNAKSVDYARLLSRALRAIRCANVRSGIHAYAVPLGARGNDVRKKSRRHASEIALDFFLFHRRAGVMVDQAALALGRGREQHLADDRGQRVGARFDRARQRIAAELAKAHMTLLRRFAFATWTTPVGAHGRRAVAPHNQALGSEIQPHDRNPFEVDVPPDIELGPVPQREHAEA